MCNSPPTPTPLRRYIPVLMGMARIYWDRGNYAQVERIFRQSAEFASEHDTWKLNVAHVFFMQVCVTHIYLAKYKCLAFLRQYPGNVHMLACLCVCGRARECIVSCECGCVYSLVRVRSHICVCARACVCARMCVCVL